MRDIEKKKTRFAWGDPSVERREGSQTKKGAELCEFWQVDILDTVEFAR